jgi:hypothetical protein
MKTSALILTAFICLIIFSSCKKNGGGNINSITGTWQLHSVNTIFDGVSSDSIYPKGSLVVTYNNNGTFSAHTNTTPPETEEGVYYIAKDSLYDHPTGISVYESEGKCVISQDSLSFISTDYFDAEDSVVTIELFLKE